MPELNDIIGQDDAIGRLMTAMQGKRLPHAFLFAGPAGVGRRTTAEAFARTLLCGSPVEQAGVVRACGQCEDCRMLAAESHPDFRMIYKELARYHEDSSVRGRKMQELGIDVIRSFLIDPVGRSPSRGRGKVFIVLEAELMSIAAQNSLLKTLEEPPAGVTIILVCQKPDRLLPTTLSRCSMIRFGPLGTGFVTDRLIAEGVDPGEAAFWASYTEGAVGRAMKLAAEGMYETKRDVIARLAGLAPAGDSKLAEHLAGLADKRATAAVTEAKKQDGAELSKLLASRRAGGTMLELIASAYRDALTLATGADRPLVHEDQHREVQALAQRFDPVELANILEALSRCEQLLWRNVNPKTVWDNAVIACASAHPLEV